MTQRSAERWNTGKRWKAWQYAEEIGEFYASKYCKWMPSWRAEGHHERKCRRVIAEHAQVCFPLSPNLRAAFRCGAWKWVERKEVSI